MLVGLIAKSGQRFVVPHVSSFGVLRRLQKPLLFSFNRRNQGPIGFLLSRGRGGRGKGGEGGDEQGEGG